TGSDRIEDRWRIQNPRYTIGVNRPSPTKGEDWKLLHILTALDRMYPGCRSHTFIRQLVDAPGCLDCLKFKRGSDFTRDDGAGRFNIERHTSTEEVLWVEITEHQIGISNRRARTPEAITGGTWLGSSAVRTDLQTVQVVDLRDGATARTDLDHFDDR